MQGILIRTAITMLGLFIASWLIPGVSIEGTGTFILAAFLLGIVNALVRPIAFLLTLPLTIITLGLFLFGPKLIVLVGSRITKLNPMRAYCVALSAAITVIVASALGLPVSSTHIAVGGVFGVGFFREWDAERRAKLNSAKRPEAIRIAPEERRRRKLVRRSHFLTIIAAWVITVPAAALISGIIFLLLRLAFVA